MDIAIWILALTATVTAVSAMARRFELPAPLLLVVIGIGASYLPFVKPFELSPELVLIGLLPPLLYSAAIRTSLVDIKTNRRAIALLAVGLVIATTVVVGLIAWWLLPIPLAAGFAFGAVVAPPDAVAATAIARRIGLPRRVVTVLEGESLLNDATALVALRTAIVAVSGAVTVAGITGDFLWAAVGGAAIGIGVALVIALLRKVNRDPLIDTALSLMAPFVAYLPAEKLHASGVIAVVTAGLILGHKAPRIQDATSRLNERINWQTIQFLLENTVFLLIGLQVRQIVDGIAETALSPWTISIFCVATLVAVILVRPLWVFPTGYYLIRPRRARGESYSWHPAAVISWAGMRGVVTLAAAFVLPASIPNVRVLVLGAFVVTAGTLLLQGLSLPWLARRLRVDGPDEREDVLAEATVLMQTVQAGRVELNRLTMDQHTDAEVLDILRRRGESRLNAVWERLGRTDTDTETPTEQYQRLRTAMLRAEREAVLEIRDHGTTDTDVLAEVMDALDVEESMIDRRSARASSVDDRTLITPARTAGVCEHLDHAPADLPATSDDGCPDCLREGTRWVHLRLCLACGNVGCCDSSPAMHADRHFHATSHPVMRSHEPGEAWRWCYVDEVLG